MSNVFYSNGTRMRFEDKLKCSKCQVNEKDRSKIRELRSSRGSQVLGLWQKKNKKGEGLSH